MPAIDYTGVTDELETIFKADSRTENARVYVEEEPQMGLSDEPGGAIAIFMEGRNATPDQPMAAGKQTRFRLRISIWILFTRKLSRCASGSRHLDRKR
jgi:hypothetical protein